MRVSNSENFTKFKFHSSLQDEDQSSKLKKSKIKMCLCSIFHLLKISKPNEPSKCSIHNHVFTSLTVTPLPNFQKSQNIFQKFILFWFQFIKFLTFLSLNFNFQSSFDHQSHRTTAVFKSNFKFKFI